MATQYNVTPLPTLTKEQAIYDQLRQAIVSGPLVPGQRLIPAEIGARFQVSSMPVRNALMRLEADRLIVRAPHREYLVAPYSAKEIKDVYAIRALLESFASRLAAESITPERLEKLRGILTRSEGHLDRGDMEGLAASNREFHTTLYSYCENEQLQDLVQSVRDRAARYRFVYYSTRKTPREQVQEHWDTMSALEAGDSLRVEALVRKHIERIRDALLNTVDGAESTRPVPPGH
jgi:DNA-binding GntR family transcriptional regulator